MAYGSDVGLDGTDRPLLVTRKSGTWTPTTLTLPPGAKPSHDSYSEVSAVSCVHDGCVAVGVYEDAKGATHFFANSRGDATAELPLTGAAEVASHVGGIDPSKEGDVLLSCWTTTHCLAALQIHFSDGGSLQNDVFDLMKYDGHAWMKVAVPTLDLPAKFGTDVDDVTCMASGRCLLGGHGDNAMGTAEIKWTAELSETGWAAKAGSKGDAGWACTITGPCYSLADSHTLISMTSDGSVTKHPLGQSVQADDFGCFAATCAFDWTGDPESGETGGSLGVWSNGSVTATSSIQPGDGTLTLTAVTCGSTKSCIEVGGYELDSQTGESRPMIEVYFGHSWASTAPTLPHGVHDGILTAAACVSATDCVAIGMTGGTVVA